MRVKALTEIDHIIAENIRFYRELRGVTQRKLGKAVGVTFQQIQKYENKLSRISASRLFEVARALRIPPYKFWFRQVWLRPSSRD